MINFFNRNLTIRKAISRRLYIFMSCLAFVIVLILWSVAAYGKFVKPYFLPAPHEVLLAGVSLFRDHDLMSDIKASSLRVTIGFIAAAVLAIPIGILVGVFKIFEAFVEPLNNFIRYMPVPAFIPLTILWVGIGDGSQIALIFIGTFFQLTIMVADVVAQVPKDYLDASATLGYGTWGVLGRVILPASSPGIFDAVRVAIGWAWSYLVLAEIVAANTGLGHMIMEAQRYLRTANVIAGILIIGLIGLIIDSSFKIAYRFLFRWTEKDEN